MPRPRQRQTDAAVALAALAPLVTRWMERLLAGHEPPLTVSQFVALQSIAREDVSASELALRTGVSGAAVSQLLSAMVGAGLVETRPAEDRRRQLLAPTTTGTLALESAERLVHARLAELLGDLPRPETDALTRLLPRVEELLAGVPPPRRPPRPPLPHRPPG